MVKEVDAPCFLKPLFTLAVGHKTPVGMQAHRNAVGSGLQGG